MSWFSRGYETESGFVAFCNRCNDEITAYTPKSLKRKKKAHKPNCRRKSNGESE